MEKSILDRYNVPGPRYTSYPTVPYWEQDSYSQKEWKKALKQAFWTSGKEVSLYIHLPFCESLCTYCACHTRITKNHEVEEKYITALLKEWQLYLEALPAKPFLKDLHLGGGTPTFFSSKNLEVLINGITEQAIVLPETEFGFEGHPNNTQYEHLKTLYELGFKRVSFGIQDFDLKVQQAINRIQPMENVEFVTRSAREIGYNSINFDLVYGLPAQTTESFFATLEKTVELNPDRIALYGYAHVPWIRPAQKNYEKLLPSVDQRSQFYQMGKQVLSDAAYQDIGMDHFAKQYDPLYLASTSGTLHRNFMGYSTQPSDLLIGLGVSAISDAWSMFSQNKKDFQQYYGQLEKDQLPLDKGHLLTKTDLIIRKHILNLMCHGETNWTEDELNTFGLGLDFQLIERLQQDQLIEINNGGLTVTSKGKPFIRNICMAFDVRMNNKNKGRFSRAI